MFDDVLRHRSGRVIALARAVLAAIFLFAIWIDPGQPVQAVAESYAMLAAYVALAIAAAVLTWNDWWLDAKLSAPAHVVDTGVFLLLVLATDGYTSPFFVFFVFLLLSAAIRWGWRQTALTAIAVILIFFAAGLTSQTEADFDLQRFIIRSGNLVILSALLIWFGVNYGFSVPRPHDDMLGDSSTGDSPLATAIVAASRMVGASCALLLWRDFATGRIQAIALDNGDTSISLVPGPSSLLVRSPYLFDLKYDRALCRGPHRRFRFSTADSCLGGASVSPFGIEEGLALPIRTDAGEGMLFLGRVSSLCTDHIDFGRSLGAALASYVQRRALLAAVEDSAVARARLSLARDLHDSIVQFLAGATFRVEAISRSIRSGEPAERELSDLKLLLLQEQQELRSAIGALRSERIALPTLASDLRALCDRLGKQWDISCRFSASVPEKTAPMRLHLDTHQLVREAVANAVRHGSAKSVTVRLAAEDDNLNLEISNDGRGSETLSEGQPWSLRERVDEASGTLMLATQEGGTSLSITLPLKGEFRT